MKNKFVQREIYDITILDKDNNQLAFINSVMSNEIMVLHGRIIFNLVDALIDKNFLEYILTNRTFEGKIKANTIYREVETYDEFSVYLDMSNVKLLKYKLKNTYKELSTVDMIFELFKDNQYKNIFWTDKLKAEKELEVFLLNFKKQINLKF